MRVGSLRLLPVLGLLGQLGRLKLVVQASHLRPLLRMLEQANSSKILAGRPTRL